MTYLPFEQFLKWGTPNNTKEAFELIKKQFLQEAKLNADRVVTVLTNVHDIKASSKLWKDLLEHELHENVFKEKDHVYEYLVEEPELYFSKN